MRPALSHRWRRSCRCQRCPRLSLLTSSTSSTSRPSSSNSTSSSNDSGSGGGGRIQASAWAAARSFACSPAAPGRQEATPAAQMPPAAAPAHVRGRSAGAGPRQAAAWSGRRQRQRVPRAGTSAVQHAPPPCRSQRGSEPWPPSQRPQAPARPSAPGCLLTNGAAARLMRRPRPGRNSSADAGLKGSRRPCGSPKMPGRRQPAGRMRLGGGRPRPPPLRQRLWRGRRARRHQAGARRSSQRAAPPRPGRLLRRRGPPRSRPSRRRPRSPRRRGRRRRGRPASAVPLLPAAALLTQRPSARGGKSGRTPCRRRLGQPTSSRWRGIRKPARRKQVRRARFATSHVV
jgi:hypothetical protein